MRKIKRRKKIKRRGDKEKRLSRKIKRSILKNEIIDHVVEFISSGCTTLNLALSGKGKHGGWARGRIFNIIGDGSSGKTLLALEVAFWFFKNIRKIKSQIFPKVKKFIICYDNGEGVMDFPVKKMYGKKFYKTVDWKRSNNFEAMCRRFIRLSSALKKGEALLYIIDSWDSFQSAKSKKDFMESVQKDEELKGDYDLAVQKYASRKFFPNICDKMDQNKVDATLCIISQVRSKIGVKFGKKQYRAGGKALDFYTHQVTWLREVERMMKKKHGEGKVYAIKAHAKVERSKVAKPFRESEFIILYDYGLDNLSSIINYLWGKGTIKFHGTEFSNRFQFIKFIEGNNLEEELIHETEKKWYKVEKAFEREVKRRKSRY